MSRSEFVRERGFGREETVGEVSASCILAAARRVEDPIWWSVGEPEFMFFNNVESVGDWGRGLTISAYL